MLTILAAHEEADEVKAQERRRARRERHERQKREKQAAVVDSAHVEAARVRESSSKLGVDDESDSSDAVLRRKIVRVRSPSPASSSRVAEGLSINAGGSGREAPVTAVLGSTGARGLQDHSFQAPRTNSYESDSDGDDIVVRRRIIRKERSRSPSPDRRNRYFTAGVAAAAVVSKLLANRRNDFSGRRSPPPKTPSQTETGASANRGGAGLAALGLSSLADWPRNNSSDSLDSFTSSEATPNRTAKETSQNGVNPARVPLRAPTRDDKLAGPPRTGRRFSNDSRSPSPRRGREDRKQSKNPVPDFNPKDAADLQQLKQALDQQSNTWRAKQGHRPLFGNS